MSNDVVPGMGVPVAAPGLRVFGLEQGLRAAGVPTIVVVAGLIGKARPPAADGQPYVKE